MKQIIAKSKKYGDQICFVDDDIYEDVSRHNWTAYKGKNTFYVCRKQKKYEGPKIDIFLHRYILKLTDKKLFVDHINGNGLDNTRENLRICDRFENGANMRINNKMTSNSTSKYKGVSFDKWRKELRKDGKNWVARIQKQGSQRHIGYFATEELAARAYDEEAKELFGEFACLNFPNEA